MTYNLFVDESCHIQHDKIPIMCIGYTKIPVKVYQELRNKLHMLKLKHKAPEEIKWNKFSKKRIQLYFSLVDYFFDYPIDFRCVLIKYKERLRHEDFNQGSHDNYYYKMAYQLLRPNPPGSEYRVFLDIKDHHGRKKLRKLEEVFDRFHHGSSPFIHFQNLPSNESPFFEITDFFIGAIGYKTRVKLGELKGESYRMNFIEYLERKSGFCLDESTPLWETKFNIFDHQPQIKE